MEPSRKKILMVIGLVAVVVLLIIIIVVVRGNSGSEGWKNLDLPEHLNSSLCPADYGHHPLLVVSMDGFRADYLRRNLTPAIQLVADKGVHAEYMMPSYPTVTFPNHYTIVTGLYPESHGIIANSFYDPVFRDRFGIGSNQSTEGRWWGGEPIWNTITRQNKRSATFFWPGSEADINEKRPTIWKPYGDGSTKYEDRVLEVLDWLELRADKRPSWACLYFDEPDHAGHSDGPDSDEVNAQLKRVDQMISLLMTGLKTRNLIQCVNVIILSDHGMTKAGSKTVVDMKEYLPDLLEQAYYQKSVVSRINPKNKSEEVELEMLRKLTCQRKEMRAYQKEGLPKRLHYSKHRRIEDILIELNPGYTTQFNSNWSLQGQHGYDNYFSVMNALFIAYGPAFKQPLKIKPFQNIELYNLMCHLTGVDPAENNGTWGSLHHILAEPPKPPKLNAGTTPSVLRFPKRVVQQQTRWNMTGCDTESYSQQPWMRSLDISKASERASMKKHLPWGMPRLTPRQSSDISLLYQNDHITGFSSSRKIALWTSFTLQPENNNMVWLQPPMSLWTSDVRLPEAAAPSCQNFILLESSNYSMFTIFPTTVDDEQSGAKSTSYLVTNAIPVHSSGRDEWLELMNILPHWTENEGPLNILMGPVFDTNDNPHIKDLLDSGISIPTDLFVVLTRCLATVTALAQCPLGQLDTRSFILHEYLPVSNCFQTEEGYFNKYSATVRDVERATDFTLFPDLPFADRLSLILKIHPEIWALP